MSRLAYTFLIAFLPCNFYEEFIIFRLAAVLCIPFDSSFLLAVRSLYLYFYVKQCLNVSESTEHPHQILFHSYVDIKIRFVYFPKCLPQSLTGSLHWRLSESKFLQYSRTLLNILVPLGIALTQVASISLRMWRMTYLPFYNLFLHRHNVESL